MHIKTKYIDAIGEACDKDVVKSYVDELDQFIQQVIEDFDFRKDFTEKLCVCGSVDKFIEKSGKTKESYKTWMVGCSNKKIGIVLLTPEVANRSLEDMKKVAKHECVHSIFEQNGLSWGVISLWLSEGLAEFLAKQKDFEKCNLNNPPKIEELDFENFAKRGGYTFSAVYVEYLYDKLGKEKFVQDLKEKRLQKYKDYELDAVQYIKQKYSKQK